MPLPLDAEIAEAFAAAAEAGPLPVTARDDPLALREVTNGTLAFLASNEPPAPAVTTRDFPVETADGATLLGRWYSTPSSAGGAAVLYLHGGGMVCGSVELYDSVVAGYVQAADVPFFSLDYRLSPEFQSTTLADDGYAGLLWLRAHAEELGLDAERIAVMGDSGGGGVAAGVAILARDASTPLAAQILIYPMLDDRNTEPDDAIAPFATWTYDNNYTGWHSLLGDSIGSPEVSPVAAPARNDDFSGLAPAYIEVGELDIFRDESIEYGRRLNAAGVSAERHVHVGAPHAFERLAPDSKVAQRSREDRIRVIRSL